MTSSTLKTFTEYNLQYAEELQAIDSLINSGEITLTEYRQLISDACSDFLQALATL